MGPLPTNAKGELESLAARLCGLLEPWAPAHEIGSDGLELAAAELEALRTQVDRERLELASQVKKARAALAEADAMAASGQSPPELEQARQGAARALEGMLQSLAHTRGHLDLLTEAIALYPQLIKQSRRFLADGLASPPPPAQAVLEAAWQSHREARRASGRCARLTGVARRIRAARQRLEGQAGELHQQAAGLNRDLAERRGRLTTLEDTAPLLGTSDGADQELDALRAELAAATGAAQALNEQCRRADQALERQQRRLEGVGRAWTASRERWGEHAARRGEAAEQALALARERNRVAQALRSATEELGRLLWPLKPAELGPELENLVAKAHALGQAATQEESQARRLQKGDSPPAGLPEPEDGRSPNAQAPPVDLAGLAELSQEAAHLAEASRAAQSRRKQQELERLQRRATAWSSQLRQARTESRQLHRLVEQLKANDRSEALSREAQQLQAKVSELTEQLRAMAVMTSLAQSRDQGQAQPGQPTARLVALDPEQVTGLLERLAQARRRLTRVSKHSLAQVALALALGSWLVLALPGMPAKATLRDHTFQVSATRLSASSLVPAPEARLRVRLVALGKKIMPLALLDDKVFTGLSDQAGLSPYSLYYSAQADLPGRAAVDMTRLEELAAQAKALRQRHPGIFADMRRGGLPAHFGRLVDAAPAGAPGQDHFADRLYHDYRRLGYGRGQALSAVAASRSAAVALIEQQKLPAYFWGRVRPIRSLESMGLERFLGRLSPYIAERCRRFLTAMGRRAPADLEGYARDLAFDMYAAAKKFAVPVSYLLTIAHQETFYANVLGDENLSASPFQIWRPTLPRILRSMRAAGFEPPPKRIRLQYHLTIATELAAFHLRELMQEAVIAANKRHPAFVDMDQVMLRYNGSKYYAGRVAVRRSELNRFLTKAGS
ncbi:MAG: hypothetical protein K9K66_10270 [Desulfarculaceae bacterium]|nr:hypothetical protein [Desulfarculaceae bacterium]MCF8073793.1 hypothetical protein [Desulfarculaceae bacterium]MCF8102034.1 hypothetical protein [Desulfarculaceae bacterium]MCF8116004.1 hypothetical protein [Desulfarculaceae bacterium]